VGGGRRDLAAAEAAGIRFAYRRFGKKGGLPLVMCRHYAGNLDNWDPAVTDGFARDREVVIFNNAGIASSGGETPETVAGMAMHRAARAAWCHRRLSAAIWNRDHAAS
jgi:hypothetical protein